MAQTATPINTTLPGAYQGQEVDAENAYQQALTNIAQQQAQTMQSYGFTGTPNFATGQLDNLHIDPNDQYSQVMGLLNSHASNIQSLRNGLLGRGLGATGLSAQQQALLKFTQGGETSALGSQFSSTLNDLYGQGQNALTTRNQQFTQAEQSALQAQIQQQQFDAAQAQTQAIADAQAKALAQANADSLAASKANNGVTKGAKSAGATPKNTNGAKFAPQPNGTVPGQSAVSLGNQGVQITPQTKVTAPNPGAGKGLVGSGIAGLGGAAGGAYVPPGAKATTLAKAFVPVSGYSAGSNSGLH